MKKIILLLIILLFALTGCAPTDTAENASPGAPAPTTSGTASDDDKDVDWVAKDRYEISPEVARFVTIKNTELYQRLYDAIDNLEDSVDISNHSSDQLEDIITVLLHKTNAEFFYLSMGERAPIRVDGTTVMIEYGYDKGTIQQMKDSFAVEVNYILNTVADTGKSELSNEIAIYTYLTRTRTYNNPDTNQTKAKEEFIKKYRTADEEEKAAMDQQMQNTLGDPLEQANTTSAYSVLANKTGICYGFAGTLTYLYNKLGIDCRTVVSVPPNHAWNMISIDGKWYHLDLTYEITHKPGGFKYFNTTDAQRQEDGYMAWAENFPEEVVSPKKSCTDTRFESLRGATSFSMEGGVLKYTTEDGELSLPLK